MKNAFIMALFALLALGANFAGATWYSLDAELCHRGDAADSDIVASEVNREDVLGWCLAIVHRPTCGRLTACALPGSAAACSCLLVEWVQGQDAILTIFAAQRSLE